MNYQPYTHYQSTQPVKRYYSQERPFQPNIQPRLSSQLLQSILGYQTQHPSSVVQFQPRSLPPQQLMVNEPPKLIKVASKETIHLLKPFSKKPDKSAGENSFKDQIEELKQIFPKNENVTVSSSSCLTVEVQEQEQYQCEKALEIMQLLDVQLNKKSVAISAEFGTKLPTNSHQENPGKKYKFSFNGNESQHDQEVKNQLRQSNLQQIKKQEASSKAYYSSKDLSKLGSSYYGASEKSFQQQQQNRIKSLHEQQLSTKSRQQPLDLQSQNELISDRYNGIKQFNFYKAKSENQNNTKENDNQNSLSSGLKSSIEQLTNQTQKNNYYYDTSNIEQQTAEDHFKQKSIQSSKNEIKKLLQDSQQINIQESSKTNKQMLKQQIQDEVMEFFQNEKNANGIEQKQPQLDFKKKESEELQQPSVMQIIQLLQQQTSMKKGSNANISSQAQQIFSTTNHSNCSSAPQIKVDVMKGSYISEQSQNSNQKKKIIILDLEPQNEYFNNNKTKQMGYFNYQISIINPITEPNSKFSSSTKRKNSCQDANNKDLYYQQEIRLKRLEEQLMKHIVDPQKNESPCIQKEINLLELSSPNNEYLLHQNSIKQKFFLMNQNNLSNLTNQYVQLPQQSSSSNLYLSKSQLLAPPLEESSSYLQSHEYVDKTTQMEEGFDLIGKKKQSDQRQKQQIQQNNFQNQNQIDNYMGNLHNEGKRNSCQSNEFSQKHVRKESRNLHGVSNYQQHLELVQNVLQTNNQDFKDISSPSLSTIQMEQSSRKQFYKQKETNFITRNKKLIQSKENKSKLDPYFEFKRQLNKNLDDFAAESCSMYNSASRTNQLHARKATAMTQFGDVSDNNRSSVQKQLYQKTIEQVQLRLHQLQRK